MNRPIVYIGAIPRSVDFLTGMKNAMISDGWVAQAILGTSTLFTGLACTPTSPATMTVNVAPGAVFSSQNIDNSAYGVISSDTVDQIIKVGISQSTLNFSCPAPGTTGQSVVYLVQAAFQETDTGATVLPYYNAANPASPWAGPSNLGTSQNTLRQNLCNVQLKAGTAATTGSQVTPSPDAGFTGLWAITVANGASTITSGNIAQVGGAPFISETLTQKISQTTGDARYLQLVNSRIKQTANTSYYVATTGNDTTGTGTAGAPWATIQHALDFIGTYVDLGGFLAIVTVADGTYSAGFQVSQPFVGAGRNGGVWITGNVTTPTNCVISTSGTCVSVNFGALVNMQGFSLTSSGTSLVSLSSSGKIVFNGNMNFGACTAYQVLAQDTGSYALLNANYSISGGAQFHGYADYGGEFYINAGVTCTLSGTPAFSGAFVGTRGGFINATGAIFSGSATGVKYQALMNGVIDTNTGNVNFFPGGSAGSTGSGGVYG